MRMGSRFRKATGADLAVVAEVLGEAFDGRDRPRPRPSRGTAGDHALRGLRRLLLERATAAGHVTMDREGTAAAAMLPPGRPCDPGELRDRVAGALGGLQEGTATPEFSEVWDACWSLEIIGVAPRAQGRGIGSGLLRYTLDTIAEDRHGAFVAVETSDPRSVSFFLRHGFFLLETGQTAEGPVTWSLLSGPAFGRLAEPAAERPARTAAPAPVGALVGSGLAPEPGLAGAAARAAA